VLLQHHEQGLEQIAHRLRLFRFNGGGKRRKELAHLRVLEPHRFGGSAAHARGGFECGKERLLLYEEMMQQFGLQRFPGVESRGGRTGEQRCFHRREAVVGMAVVSGE